MDTDDTSRLAEERHLATTEERKVLALEMIADHLEKISRGFAPIDDGRGSDAPLEAVTATGGDSSVADKRDEESASTEQGSPEAQGVERTQVEHFAVAGYNYTNLAHAIAQAKRARRNGEHQ